MLLMKWRGAEIQPRTMDSLIAIYEVLFQFLFKRTDCPGFSNGDWNYTPYFRPDISYGLLAYRTTAENGN